MIGIERPTSRRAHFTEFGTVHQAAQPFLRPAIDEEAHTAISVMTEAMEIGISREVAKLKSKHRTP